MNLNIDAPAADDPYTDNNDAIYPYYFYNCKNKKNNMTPNTDAPDDAPILLLMMLPSTTLLFYIPLLNVKLTPIQWLN